MDGMEENLGIERSSSAELKRLNDREKELYLLRQHVHEQEKQLEAYRAKLKNEQLDREKKFQKELDAREHFFAEREKKLFERQREFEENLLIRQQEIEKLRSHLGMEISKKESELEKMRLELQQEIERYNEESRKKIEHTSKDYVSDALNLLGKKEAEFHSRSKTWAAIGAASLLGGISFFGYVTIASFSTMPNQLSWEFITFSIFKGLLAVALFAALAKYSFIFSNSYMRETLKNADRRHAINFGKFYLESFGATAEWSQIKEAFEHWNISGENNISKNEYNKFDITILEKIANFVEKIGKSIPTKD